MENLEGKKYEMNIMNSSEWKISKDTTTRALADQQSLTKAKIIK